MKRRKILIVTPGTCAIPSARMSSVETVVVNVAGQLTDGNAVAVCGGREARMPSRTRRDGILHVRFRRKHYIDKVKRFVRRWRPDVVQVENRPRSARILKDGRPGCPVILSLHSTRYVSMPHIGTRTLYRCLQRVDAVVVNSEYMERHLRSRFPKLATPVFVNHLGVDTTHFVPWMTEAGMMRRIQVRHRYGWGRRKVILYAGRLLRQKGVHHLIAAMPKIVETVPEAMLVIVGRAYYSSNRRTPYVRKLHASAANMSGHVRFLPFVPHDRMRRLFTAADIVAVPSVRTEAFGLVNVEAMATGVPVVASDIGGIGEVIDDVATGFLVDPLRMREELPARLIRLLADDELRLQMGMAGLVRVHAAFTWQKTADRWSAVYDLSKYGVTPEASPNP